MRDKPNYPAAREWPSTFNDWRAGVGPYCDYDGHVPVRLRFAGTTHAAHLAPDDAEAMADRLRELADEGRRMQAGDPPLRYWARLSNRIRAKERR